MYKTCRGEYFAMKFKQFDLPCLPSVNQVPSPFKHSRQMQTKITRAQRAGIRWGNHCFYSQKIKKENKFWFSSATSLIFWIFSLLQRIRGFQSFFSLFLMRACEHSYEPFYLAKNQDVWPLESVNTTVRAMKINTWYLFLKGFFFSEFDFLNSWILKLCLKCNQDPQRNDKTL